MTENQLLWGLLLVLLFLLYARESWRAFSLLFYSMDPEKQYQLAAIKQASSLAYWLVMVVIFLMAISWPFLELYAWLVEDEESPAVADKPKGESFVESIELDSGTVVVNASSGECFRIYSYVLLLSPDGTGCLTDLTGVGIAKELVVSSAELQLGFPVEVELRKLDETHSHVAWKRMGH